MTSATVFSKKRDCMPLAAPSRRKSVAYARILIEVKSLPFLIIHALGQRFLNLLYAQLHIPDNLLKVFSLQHIGNGGDGCSVVEGVGKNH